MTKKLEIERKWLIKSPLSFDIMKEIWKRSTSVVEIYQIYLKSDKGITNRYRSISPYLEGDYVIGDSSLEIKYYHTIKKSISPGISEEDEREISEIEAEKLCHRSNVDDRRGPISKKRYNFKYKNQNFELDVFNRPFTGLVILELELDDLKQKVKLPKFLPSIKEVTEDKRFTNSNLAKLSDLRGLFE